MGPSEIFSTALYELKAYFYRRCPAELYATLSGREWDV